MNRRFRNLFVNVIISSLVFLGITQSAQAALISTEQVVAAGAAQQARVKVAAALQRAEVLAALGKYGISAEEAQARTAALSDAEAVSVAQQIDTLPAGGSDIVGALIFIFVVLLVTDILGLTKVFPFTRSVRH
ncbi:PA2779 family protein [Massilia sp. R2A-15]|uniref:PA2779 family protein n=1 Tax=Massilia sp. R2A-15 TaxID=3064278 RepID=UPI002732E0C5|nr:PA2779 family protein [Massilia sp. R2A-15]WLI89530.1 PA2779 family protein [Massilia sp. R2A-15]